MKVSAIELKEQILEDLLKEIAQTKNLIKKTILIKLYSMLSHQYLKQIRLLIGIAVIVWNF